MRVSYSGYYATLPRSRDEFDSRYPLTYRAPRLALFFMKKLLNATQLKFLAAGLMVLDHLRYFWAGTPDWFSYLGRIVAPIFFFLVVEGFWHTRNRWRYLGRLTLGGVVMALGSGLLNHFLPAPVLININIFWPLALSVALMITFETLKENKFNLLALLSLPLIVSLFLFVEGSWLLLGVTLIFYFARQRWSVLFPIFISWAFVWQIIFWEIGVSGSANYQWLMIFSLPLLWLYNGQRGQSAPALKHFFYLFYPLHIWIIYLIGLKWRY